MDVKENIQVSINFHFLLLVGGRSLFQSEGLRFTDGGQGMCGVVVFPFRPFRCYFCYSFVLAWILDVYW